MARRELMVMNGPNQQNKYTVTKSLTENIIVIGAELHYDSFWWKMMFIAAGVYVANKDGVLRRADLNTIAYLDKDYTKAEKLPIELLKDKKGFNILSFRHSSDVVAYVNNRSERQVGDKKGQLMLQDVFLFCHGLPGRLAFDYRAPENWGEVKIGSEEISSMRTDAFSSSGRIYSYACRTGVSEDKLLQDEFKNDAEAEPEKSLAQQMANHFKVEVMAFMTRSWYGDILRVKTQSNSDRITAAFKAALDGHEGEILEISPDYEAIPHEDLGGFGAWREGTSDYALWRKKGGIGMPTSAETPKGLRRGLRLFKPL
jgi:hypothetical protein